MLQVAKLTPPQLFAIKVAFLYQKLKPNNKKTATTSRFLYQIFLATLPSSFSSCLAPFFSYRHRFGWVVEAKPSVQLRAFVSKYCTQHLSIINQIKSILYKSSTNKKLSSFHILPTLRKTNAHQYNLSLRTRRFPRHFVLNLYNMQGKRQTSTYNTDEYCSQNFYILR